MAWIFGRLVNACYPGRLLFISFDSISHYWVICWTYAISELGYPLGFIFPFQVGILLHLASARAHQSLSIETALIIGGRWRYVFSFWICITWAVLTLLLSKLHCCFCFGNALHRVLPDLELICTCIDALKRMIRFWASCVHISWWYSFWTSHFTYKIQFIVCAFHFNMHRLAGVIPWWVKVLKRGWGTPKII